MSDDEQNEETNVDDLIKEEMRIFRQRNRSRLRIDAENLLKNADLVNDRRLAVLNLDNGEIHRFNSFPEALEFMKEKKGRWYVTTPGLERHVLQDRSRSTP
ncbi:MAG: hypothetical protein ACXQT4_03755 [Methanotrichaceae archaeon]